MPGTTRSRHLLAALAVCVTALGASLVGAAPASADSPYEIDLAELTTVCDTFGGKLGGDKDIYDCALPNSEIVCAGERILACKFLAPSKVAMPQPFEELCMKLPKSTFKVYDQSLFGCAWPDGEVINKCDVFEDEDDRRACELGYIPSEVPVR